MKNRMSKLGFTLIELLIVITIIGILAVVFLPSIMGAPAKSRDAARMADMTNVVEAINAGKLDGLSVSTGDGKILNGCLSDGTRFPDDYYKYFANGIPPVDPGGLGVGNPAWGVAAKCDDGYYIKRYTGVTADDYPFGVFAQVENLKNANSNCYKARQNDIEGQNVFTPPANCDTDKCCYGVLSN